MLKTVGVMQQVDNVSGSMFQTIQQRSSLSLLRIKRLISTSLWWTCARPSPQLRRKYVSFLCKVWLAWLTGKFIGLDAKAMKHSKGDVCTAVKSSKAMSNDKQNSLHGRSTNSIPVPEDSLSCLFDAPTAGFNIMLISICCTIWKGLRGLGNNGSTLTVLRTHSIYE